MDASKQLSLSTTTQEQEDASSSYTSKVTNALGSYYGNTLTFLTDECGVGAYSMAMGKAVVYGIGGDVWGASKGSLYGVAAGVSIEGLVIGSIIGSGLGLAVGVKNAYDGFKADTARCSS